MEKGYQLHRRESPGDSLRRIWAWQAERTAKIFRDETMSMQERVHEARKRIKETRALLRLFRGALGDAFDEENRLLRDAGRELAPYRDSTTLVEAVKALSPRVRKTLGVRTMRVLRTFAKERQRAQFADESALREQFETLIVRLAGANERLANTALPVKTRFSIIEDDLARTVSSGRRSMASAFKAGSGTAFHEWRKRVKDFGHQLELLINVWPKVMSAMEKEITTLAHHLGHHHDLALVAEVVRQTEEALGGPAEMHRAGRVIANQQKLAAKFARPIAERIYAVRPREIVREIAAWWDTWHD
jgi:CHAD domain-containing protein